MRRPSRQGPLPVCTYSTSALLTATPESTERRIPLLYIPASSFNVVARAPRSALVATFVTVPLSERLATDRYGGTRTVHLHAFAKVAMRCPGHQFQMDSPAIP